jgi:hypothetical protein
MSNPCKHEKVMPLSIEGDKWCSNCGAVYKFWNVCSDNSRCWHSPDNATKKSAPQHDPTPPVNWRLRIEGLEDYVRKMETQWETRFDRIVNHPPASSHNATDARANEEHHMLSAPIADLDACISALRRDTICDKVHERKRFEKILERMANSAFEVRFRVNRLLERRQCEQKRGHDQAAESANVRAEKCALDILQDIYTSLRDYRDNRVAGDE